MFLTEFGGMEESALSDINGATGVVDMASIYSSTGLRIWQNPNIDNKGRFHYLLDHQIIS